MKSLLIILLIQSLINLNSAFFPNHVKTVLNEDDPSGDPLILTPLIEQNKTEEARLAAEVHLDGAKDIKSYSGYFTVDKKFNSNMFFWFFPSQTDWTTDPVLLWLQGGPGATSLLGLFAEHGPFSVTSDLKLKLRLHTWTKSHSVIYMDNPVGTGFSFTDSNGFAQNQTKVGEDLFAALQQFFLLFPEMQKNDFFVTGESYGGKYVPAISHTIHQKNPEANVKINLKGLAMGNGWSDPENQLKYSDYLYQLGLIDSNAKDIFKSMETEFVKDIKTRNYAKAFDIFNDIIFGNGIKQTLFNNVTGFKNRYNYLYSEDPSMETKYMEEYVQLSDVRKAIHVGNASFNDGHDVSRNLKEDIIQSVAPWISKLLDNYRVLVYNGQLDIIVGYPLTVSYLQKLNFSSSEQYKTAPRNIWKVGNDIAGYVKVAGNLTEVLVRDSGHMVPSDQPEWALDLITRFVRDKPFY